MIPQIQILHLREGAQEARGLTVVIDVCRAFTTAAFCAAQGAGAIYPVGRVDEAFLVRERFNDALIIGEVKGRKPEAFDLGNSPSELLEIEFLLQPIIQRTSAGTQGIVNARHADEILTGAFVNAGAIVRYIKEAAPETVSLVCMGWEAKRPCEEDTLCAELIRDRLNGKETDFAKIAEQVWESETAYKFRDPERPWMPEADLALCLDLDRFDFVLRLNSDDAIPFLERIDV